MGKLGKPLSSVKPWNEEKKWEDEVEWLVFPENKQILVRVVGDVVVLARHWIKTLTNKTFPAWCPQFDSQQEIYDSKRPCPAHDDFSEKSQKVIVGKCIVRSLQERGDDNPTRAFMLPHAILDDFNAISEIIKCDPADPEKGVDLAIKFSPKAQGNKKWGAQRGDTTALTKDELKYDYPKLEEGVIPDFSDPEIAAQYAKSMKTSMARNKYYVVQEERVPEGARDPFKFFKGSDQGKPWHHFPELVDFRNDQAKDKVETTHKVTKDDDVEASIKDEPRAEFKKRDPEEESPPAKKEAKPAPEDDAPPPAKKEAAKEPETEEAPPAKKEVVKEVAKDAKPGVHPDASIKSKEHPKHGTVPECFENYDGKQKCQRCPVRSKCIDLTDDNDV